MRDPITNRPAIVRGRPAAGAQYVRETAGWAVLWGGREGGGCVRGIESRRRAGEGADMTQWNWRVWATPTGRLLLQYLPPPSISSDSDALFNFFLPAVCPADWQRQVSASSRVQSTNHFCEAKKYEVCPKRSDDRSIFSIEVHTEAKRVISLRCSLRRLCI